VWGTTSPVPRERRHTLPLRITVYYGYTIKRFTTVYGLRFFPEPRPRHSTAAEFVKGKGLVPRPAFGALDKLSYGRAFKNPVVRGKSLKGGGVSWFFSLCFSSVHGKETQGRKRVGARLPCASVSFYVRHRGVSEANPYLATFEFSPHTQT